VSKLYDESDQRVWEIKCIYCGTGTVLEFEFPGCIVESSPGKFIRACRKCKREIFPRDGRWVVQFPNRSQDLVGYWISRLNSAYIDFAKAMKVYNNPNHPNRQEFYNSTLAQGYVEAENRLAISDILSCCNQDGMDTKHDGPCGMGIDVGKELAIVVGYRPTEKTLRINYTARVSSFNDAHDIGKRFNVKQCVVDAEPETRKAREFAESEPYQVFLCDYQDKTINGPAWDEEKKWVRCQRTETCDATHEAIMSGLTIIPRKSEEILLFAKQCCAIAKVLETDQETGSRTYKYRKLAEDHYRHAFNYFWMAAKRIGVYEPQSLSWLKSLENKEHDYNPLTHGLSGTA
jgi:hypothetical protein